MKKTVIVYQSKYGSTKQYALWLGEELGCEVLERKNVKTKQLLTYDVIVYGGGLYAGGVAGLDLIAKSFDRIKDKHLIVFTCGLANPTDADNQAHIREGIGRILSPNMQKQVKLFFLRGGINYSRLGFVHKSMMAMLYHGMKNKAFLRAEDKQMLDTYGEVVDFKDKSTLEPLVAYIKTLE